MEEHQSVCQISAQARTHTHLLLGCNVASAQPHSAAKSESNILCSPHVARPWPRPQWKLHISVTLSVLLSVRL